MGLPVWSLGRLGFGISALAALATGTSQNNNSMLAGRRHRQQALERSGAARYFVVTYTQIPQSTPAPSHTDMQNTHVLPA